MASLPPPPSSPPATAKLAFYDSSVATKVSSFHPSLCRGASTPPAPHPRIFGCGAFISNNSNKESFSDSNAPLPLSLLQNRTSVNELRQIHTYLTKSSSKLLTSGASARSIDLDHAHKLIFSYPHRNFLLWNSLIHGYSQSSMPETSIMLFVRLLEEDPFLINHRIFSPILKACVKISALFEGRQIHSCTIKYGMLTDSYVQNSLIQMYFGCGKSSFGQLLFDKMPERTVVTWNCLIAGYSELGLWEKVVALFWMMVEEALVEPNLVTLVRMVTACARSRDFNSGNRIHRYIVDNGVPLWLNLGNALMNMFMKFGDIRLAHELFDEMPNRDVVSWTTLVSGYSNAGLISEALDVFTKMPGRNIVSWNAMIAGYVLNGCFKEAVLLYKEMLVLNVKPDKSTILSVLSACARSEALTVGKVIHGYISKVGFHITLDMLHSVLSLYSKCGEMNMAELLFRKMTVRNEIPWTLMMTGYVRCQEIEVAMEIFNQMPNKDIASWNALITVLAQNNHFIEALSIFQDMLRMNVTPNSITFVSLLSACSSIGALDPGKWIHNYITRNNFKMDAQLSTSLIDMYAKCGFIELSLEVFYSTTEKDLLVWSTIIRGLAMHGQSKLALKIFRQMEGCGMQPDAITYLGVLSACNHAGLLEEGRHHFCKMTKIYGISPTTEHYSCMVDLLGRRGLLEEAKDFIHSANISSKSEAIWGALLGACKLHGDAELAEYAANRLLEVDPKYSGAYVLLSNLYAKESKWDNVRTVRTLMKERDIKKVPGCSSIEVNGVFHEFFIGDSSHPSSGHIYGVLAELEKISKIM